MRFAILLAAVTSAVAVVADDLKPFLRVETLQNRSPLDILRRQSCPSGYTTCGDGCKPTNANCCGSNGNYCDSGYSCTPNGCCPTGKTCSGNAGTIPVYLTYTTAGGGGGSGPTVRASSSPGVGGGSGGGGGGGGGSSPGITRSTPTITRSSSTTSISCTMAGRQVCGNFCILASLTCCPDNAKYCSRGQGCVQTYGSISGEIPEYGCTSLTGAAAASATANGGNFLTVGAGQVWAAGAMVAGAAVF